MNIQLRSLFIKWFSLCLLMSVQTAFSADIKFKTINDFPEGISNSLNKNAWVDKWLNADQSNLSLCSPAIKPLFIKHYKKPAKLIRVDLTHSTLDESLIVYTKDTISESITVFYQTDKQCWEMSSFGRTLATSNQSLTSPYPNIKLPITTSPRIYILHQDSKRIRPWIDILPESNFVKNNSNVWMMLGVYTGVFVVLIIFGLLMLVWQKSRITLFYVLYALAGQFYGFQALGVGPVLFEFWPDPVSFKLLQVLAVSMIIGGIAIVTVEFLKIKGRLFNLIMGGVFVSCSSFLLSYWWPVLYILGAMVLLPVAVTTLIVLIVKLKDGDSAVRWFSLGLSASVIGGGIQAVTIITGGSGVPGLAAFAFVIGNLIESSIWFFAIAVRLRSDRHRIEKKLIYDATHDSLTGLANRTVLKEQLKICIHQLKENSHHKYALLFIDLDRFKYVNDSMGHTFGDQILVKTAKIMTSLSHDSIVTRFGGDEFIILIQNPCELEHAIELAGKICTAIENNLKVDGMNLHISTTTGIVMMDSDYHAADEVIRDADTALYQAKKLDVEKYCIYEAIMHETILNKFTIEHEISAAIEDKQFEMYFQPIVDLSNDKLTGFESLVRWNHPQKGFVSPDDFIPIAEETGQIIQLGSWILKDVIQQVGEWKKEGCWPQGNYVTINVSGVQLSDEHLLATFEGELIKNGVEGKDVRVELTETAVITNQHVADVILPSLNEHGVRLCMDDFGTGYSSFTYLNELNFDVLKIDRSFIMDMEFKSSAKTLVRTVMAMAKEMKLLVVAEGIENEEQAALLKEMDCDYGQGYYFAKPMNEASARKLLLDN